jgi:hypothetical protein
MRKFIRRRLNDSIFFVILMVLLGGFAMHLHINVMHPATVDGSNLILQAQAWLHGHLDIGIHIHDSIRIGGKFYIVYPPLPALLMVPFVALLGAKFSDVWFTWAFAALNIILLFRTLEVMRVRSITNRLPLENLIIALTFGFGTIALWLCLGGKVWFTVQTISIFGIMLTLHSTLSRRWPLATLGIGMVLLTRTSDALMGIVPLIVYLHDLGIGRHIQNRWHFLPQRWPSIRELAAILAPFSVALLIYLVHNKLYFNNPLSTGFDIQNQQNYPTIKYGILSWHYIWPNFVVDFLRWPTFNFAGALDLYPQPDFFSSGIGTSIFFSTPLLVIFLSSPQGKTTHNWLRNTLWITVALMLISVLLYCTTGWNQVGSRYLFGFYPLLFLLLAQRVAPLDIRWIGLAGLSIFINLLLARTFWEGHPGKSFAVGCAAIVLVACTIAIIMLRRQKQQPKPEKITPLAPVMIPAEST